MTANRVPRPFPLLDAATAERLLRGGSFEELPDEYRQLGQLLMATRAPALPHELEGSAAAAASFVAAHDAIRPAPLRRPRSLRAPALPRRLDGSPAAADPLVAVHDTTRPASRRRPRSLAAMAVVGVLMAAASTGSAVAATHGSLPEPVQQVADDALGVVGISVPGIESSRDLRNTVDPAVSSQPVSGAGSGAPAGRGGVVGRSPRGHSVRSQRRSPGRRHGFRNDRHRRSDRRRSRRPVDPRQRGPEGRGPGGGRPCACRPRRR